MQIFEPVLETILGDRTVHVAKATNHRFLTLQRTKEQYNQLVLEAIHAAAAPAAQQDLSVADKHGSSSDVLVWIRDRPALTIQHTSLLTGLPLQNPDEHVDPFNLSYVKLTAQLPSENPHDAKMLPDEMLLNPDKLNDAGNRSVGPQAASSPADQHDVALIIEDKTSTLASRGKKRPSSFLVPPESNERTADEASTDVISVIEKNNGNVPDNNYEDIIGEILSDHPLRALKRNATLAAKADLAKTTNAKKLPPKVASVPSNSVAKIANKTATKATITTATIIPTEHTTIECIPKTTTAAPSAITTTTTTKVTSPSITTATDASTRLDKGKAKVIDLASSKVVAADVVNSSPVEKDKSTEGQQRETANSLAVKSSTPESTPTKQWVYRSTDIGVLKPINTADRKRKARETVHEHVFPKTICLDAYHIYVVRPTAYSLWPDQNVSDNIKTEDKIKSIRQITGKLSQEEYSKRLGYLKAEYEREERMLDDREHYAMRQLQYEFESEHETLAEAYNSDLDLLQSAWNAHQQQQPK